MRGVSWGCLSEALPEGESVNREGQLAMIGRRVLNGVDGADGATGAGG